MGMSTGYTTILYTHMKMAKLVLFLLFLQVCSVSPCSMKSLNRMVIQQRSPRIKQFQFSKFSRRLMACQTKTVRLHARTWKNAMLGLGLKKANNAAYDRLTSNQLAKKEIVESRQLFQLDKKQQPAMLTLEFTL